MNWLKRAKQAMDNGTATKEEAAEQQARIERAKNRLLALCEEEKVDVVPFYLQLLVNLGLPAPHQLSIVPRTEK